MSNELMFRGVVAMAFAALLTWKASTEPLDEAAKTLPESGIRYRTLTACLFVPGILSLVYSVMYGDWSRRGIRYELFSRFAPVFLHIAVYYILLLLIMPLLRRRIRPRTCAMLWSLPTYSFLFLVTLPLLALDIPLLTIPIPYPPPKFLSILWAAGFAGVLMWKIGGHLIFSRQILRGAVPVPDPDVQEILTEEIQNNWARVREPRVLLVRSPAVSTPLSLRPFLGRMRIVLPQRDFTPEEYHLILRHELVHISRNDAGIKFALMLISAVCWFLPPLWLVPRKSAEDQELSCDESMLLNEEEPTRQEYARLLLRTAGDDRGFSTCLSAAASTLRYRLRAVTDIRPRPTGAPAVAILSFFLFLACGFVTFVLVEPYVQEEAFPGVTDVADITVVHVSTRDSDYTPLNFEDFSPFWSWLAEQPTEKTVGNYTFSTLSEESERYLSLMYFVPGGYGNAYLLDNYLLITFPGSPSRNVSASECYRLLSPVDWSYIDTLIPQHLSARITLTDADGRWIQDNPMDLTWCGCVTPGREHLRVVQTATCDISLGEGVKLPCHADCSFSLPPAAPVKTIFASWDWESQETLSSVTDGSTWTCTLPSQRAPSRFVVRSSFIINDLEFEAEFQVSLNWPDITAAW